MDLGRINPLLQHYLHNEPNNRGKTMDHNILFEKLKYYDF